MFESVCRAASHDDQTAIDTYIPVKLCNNHTRRMKDLRQFENRLCLCKWLQQKVGSRLQSRPEKNEWQKKNRKRVNDQTYLSFRHNNIIIGYITVLIFRNTDICKERLSVPCRHLAKQRVRGWSQLSMADEWKGLGRYVSCLTGNGEFGKNSSHQPWY